jgi:hypothetical protein
MSILFDELNKLDGKFSAAWKEQTKDSERALTPKEFETLVSKLDGLNEGAARCILELAKRKHLPATAEAILKPFVDKWATADKLNYISNDAISKQISDVLGSALVSKILFKSPLTNHSYSPSDYALIGRLVADKKIGVRISNTGMISNLATAAGTYNSDTNVLTINTTNNLARVVTTIHEATHAILDWNDADIQVNQGEADCRVAEALAFHAALKKFPDVDPKKVASGDASEQLLESQIEIAKLVLAGDSSSAKPKFSDAFKKLNKAVDRVYADKVGKKALTVLKGEKNTESKVWQSLQKELAAVVK